MTQDLYYYESGYIDDSYFVYTADAESMQSSAFTVTASVGVIKQSTVTLSSQFVQTATISHIEGADLFAMSEAALAAEVSRIRDNNIDVASAFTQVVSGAKFIHFSSDQNATATVVADNLRIRYTEAAANAAFSLTADLTRQPGVVVTGSGTWTSQFDIEAKGTRKTNIIDVNVAAAFELTTIGNRLRGINDNFDVNTGIAIDFNRIRSTAVDLSSTSTLLIPGERIIQFSSTENAAFSPSINCVVTKNSFAVLDATTALQAQATITRTTAIALSSQATTTLTALRIKQLSSQVTTTAAVSAILGINKKYSSAVTSAFALSASGVLSNRRPRQVTEVGTPVFSSTKKFGTASIKFPNQYPAVIGPNYLTIPTAPELNNWGTLDFWVYIEKDSNYNSGVVPILTSTKSTAPNYNWYLVAQATSTNTYLQYTDANGANISWATNRISYSTWTHVHLTKSGSTITYWLNGVQQTPSSSSGTITSSYAANTGMYIGRADSIANYHTLYLDDLLIRSDVVVGGSVPIEQITVSDQTNVEMLFHFNNDYVDDMTVVAQASASLTCTAQVTATSQANKSAQAALVSQSTMTPQATGFVKFVINMQANGFVVAATGRIRPEVAALDSAFELTAQAKRTRSTAITMQSAFTLQAQALDLDLAQANLSSQFTLQATANKIREFISTEPTYSYLQASAKKIIPSWKIDTWGRGLTPDTVTTKLIVVNNDSYELGNYQVHVGSSTFDGGLTIIKRELGRGNITWKMNYPIDAASTHTIADADIQEYQGRLYANLGFYNSSDNSYSNTIMVVDTANGNVLTQLDTRDFSRINNFIIDNDYLYVSGTSTYSGPVLRSQLIKYDLSGNIQWNRQYSITGAYPEGGKLFMRTSGLYWASSVNNSTGTSIDLHLNKINPTTGASSQLLTFDLTDVYDVYVDADEFIYVSAAVSAPKNTHGVIIKANSAGIKQWSKNYNRVGYSDNYWPGSITCDSDSNIYIASRLGHIISLDSTGAVRWSRLWTNTGGSGAFFNALTVVDDTLYIGGNVGQNTIIWSAPKDTGGADLASIHCAITTFDYVITSTTANAVTYSIPAAGTATLTNAKGACSYINAYTSANTSTAFSYIYAVNAFGNFDASAVQNTTATRILGLPPQALTSTASMVIHAIKKASAISTEQVTCTVQAAIKRTRSTAVTLNSTATVQAQGIRGRYVVANLAVTASLTVSTKVNKPFVIAASSTATLVAPPYNFTKAQAYLQVTATLTANALRIKQLSSHFDAIATELAAVVKTGQGFIHLDSAVTVNATVRKVTDVPQHLTSTATLTARYIITKFGQAALTSRASVSANVDKIKRVEVQTTAQCSMTCNLTATRRTGSVVQAQATQSTQTLNSKITRITADLRATATQTSNNQIVRLAQAHMFAVTSIPLALGGVMVRFEANLTAFDSVLVAGRVINIDPYYQLQIKPEARGLIIYEESRKLAIKGETRVNIIKGKIL